MSARPAAVRLHRRVKSFGLSMRRLERHGRIVWDKGDLAHACHAEVNAGRGAVADRWVAMQRAKVAGRGS